MRTEVWYPLLFFPLFAWLVLVIETAITWPFKQVSPWITWGTGVLSGLLSLVGGFYATKDTWIDHLVKWVAGIHPAVLLVLAAGFIVGVVFLALAAVPDKFSSTALTSGLIIVAFFMPLLAKYATPPGSIGDNAREGVQAVANFAVDQTRGWVTGAPTAKGGK